MLTVQALQFSYPNQQVAVKAVSFEVKTGEHVALIGESGCGKSSLLHLIFGKLQPDAGNVIWNGKTIKGPLQKLIPGEEDVKLLTQEFDLMPFISVEQNITKHLSRMYPERNHKRCKELLRVVDLEGYENRMVKELSGGQKQRVAIAQCLANQPKLLLMDEPFSHIDQFKKNKLRRKLFSFLKKEMITCIYATHDPKDMLNFSDKTLVMSKGKLIDFRSPKELYQNPRSELVASLFEETNIVPNGLLATDVPEGNYLFYPNEITLSIEFEPKSCEVSIENRYFMGDSWLIEVAHPKGHRMLVLSKDELVGIRQVFIGFKKIDFGLRKL